MTGNAALADAAMQLRFYVYDTIGRLYAGSMFEIMRDFPDTEAAVLDCGACMKRTSLHQHVVDSLTAAVRSRLLHPGARRFCYNDMRARSVRACSSMYLTCSPRPCASGYCTLVRVATSCCCIRMRPCIGTTLVRAAAFASAACLHCCTCVKRTRGLAARTAGCVLFIASRRRIPICCGFSCVGSTRLQPRGFTPNNCTGNNHTGNVMPGLRVRAPLPLHRAGVATENILDGYINTIRVLQKIDGNGILMTAVTLPIKAYLRSRPDTIHCVVKMLTQVRSDIRLIHAMRRCPELPALSTLIVG